MCASLIILNVGLKGVAIWTNSADSFCVLIIHRMLILVGWAPPVTAILQGCRSWCLHCSEEIAWLIISTQRCWLNRKINLANINVSCVPISSLPDMWAIRVVPFGYVVATAVVSEISERSLNAALVEGIRWCLEARAMPACCHGQRVRCAVQAAPAGRLGRREDVHVAQVHREWVRRHAHLHHR